jgi:hypothetical protein
LDFTDYLALGDGWGFESGFFSFGRWYGVLNQDLQDFEDFLRWAMFGRVRAAAYN